MGEDHRMLVNSNRQHEAGHTRRCDWLNARRPLLGHGGATRIVSP
jgi:hypothetical protein